MQKKVKFFFEEIMSTNTTISFEEVTPLHSLNAGKEFNIEPCVGMKFDSIEKVRKFYTSFVKKNDFGIHVRSSKEKIVILVFCCEDQHKMKNCVNGENKHL